MLSHRACVFLSVVAVPALTHAQAEVTSSAVLDCEHPPAQIARVLPQAVAAVAIMECTPSAQFIVAREGWSWRYPGSFVDRPIIPAYAPTESRVTPGPRFFTGFRVEELSDIDAQTSHEKFAKELPTYRQAAPPAHLVKLIATNDLGLNTNAYFGFRTDREGWVVLCTPDCAPENMFLIQKVE